MPQLVFETLAEVPQGKDLGVWSILSTLKSGLQKLIDLFGSTDNEWKLPYLLNDWQRYSDDYPPARYRKDACGNVYLGGVVKDGTPGSSSDIFELPEGFRPDAQLEFVVSSDEAPTNATRCRITIEGQVIAMTGGDAFYSLDNISFKAA